MITQTDIEIMQRVDKWFKENHDYLKLDAYYGIDILADVHRVVIECIEIYNKRN
jgi:hypothetical protein